MTIIILAVVLFVILCVALWAVIAANRFRRLTVKISEGASGIDVALMKRYDTLTKMLEVCRQYAAHEVETFAKTIELRQGMSMPERREASVQMDGDGGAPACCGRTIPAAALGRGVSQPARRHP